jgi:hypothetical protein
MKAKITALKSCIIRAHGATTLVPIDKPSNETQCIVQNDYAKKRQHSFFYALAYLRHPYNTYNPRLSKGCIFVIILSLSMPQ